MVKIKIAGIVVALDNKYEYTERYVKDYVTDEEADFTVFATEEEIQREYEISGVRISDEYAENVVLYRKIAERLPEYDAAVFHGAVLEYGGIAYAVTAHSGVGKTTHLRLWHKVFADDVKVLNGDKPILRVIDGTLYACATPWRGKEGYGYNAIRPLGAIGFLSRGTENKSRRITADGAVMKFMNQVYLSKEDARSLTLSIRLCDRILSSVPLYEFECNMQEDAARVSYDAFVNSSTTEQ